MRISQPSRRNFLSSLVILSAGSAFGSVTNFFKDTEDSLEHHWKQFCNNWDARPYAAFVSPGVGHHFQPCKGHFYKTGEPVFLENSSLVAVPIWIYWGKEKSKPDDIIITFLQQDSKQKVGSINRFELTALNTAVPAQGEQVTLIQDIIKNKGNKRETENRIKTQVHKGKFSQIELSIAGHRTTIKKTIIYNA